MTPDRRTPDGFHLPPWAVPLVVSAIVTLAVAWAQLSGTESASAHASDIAAVRADHTADINRLQSQHDLERVRDSARHADVMRGQAEQTRILLDLQRKVSR